MLYEGMFGQINVLSKAMDASLLKQQTINNNIANSDTPGYKKQTVEFESYLASALKSANNKATDVDLNSINGKVILENPEYSMRLDENNVDIDVEMTESAKNSLKYASLQSCVTNDFEKLNIVLNSLK